MNAFITGSRAYGTPRRNSDIDLVIRCDEATADLLKSLSDEEDLVVFRNLNLILCTSDEDFAVWKHGTDLLKMRRPVSKGAAKTLLKSMRESIKVPDDNPSGGRADD
jgi:predicted nucleotidyltransferase